MRLLDGKKLSQKILKEIKGEVAKNDVKPGLGVVLVGDDEASQMYVALKEKAAKEAGMIFKKKFLGEKATQEEVIQAVKNLNQDKEIFGIIVQLPLPEHIDENNVIENIDPQKDADGFHQVNLENFFANAKTINPVFPEAILALIESSEIDLENKKAVIVANSDQFGKTMKKTLEKEDMEAEYFLCNDFQKNRNILQKADIVITACGEPNLIGAEDVKEKSIIIDGGITKDTSGKTIGDVNRKSFETKDAFLSPVPGGVGPLTIACLLKNVLENYKKSLE